MICSEAQYQGAARRRKDERERLAQHRLRLESSGLSTEEIQRVLDPIQSFHLQLDEEIACYERRMTAERTRTRPEHATLLDILIDEWLDEERPG